jgi:hypothetical protein
LDAECSEQRNVREIFMVSILNTVRKLPAIAASGFSLFLTSPSVQALSVTPDVILADAPSGLSASIDMSVLGNVLTVSLRNTSASGSATGADGLLTGIAFYLPASYTINSGMALITMGSSVVNVGNPIPGGNDISGEWGYQNSGGGHFVGLVVNRQVSTMEADTAIKFSNTPIDKPNVLGGPDYGLVSTTGNPGGLTAIADSATIVLNLDNFVAAGDIDSFLSTINDGIVAVTFGSPSSGVPDAGSSAMMLGLGLAALGWYSRRKESAKV